ncbi:MAG: IclR family transcriptional regulator [Pseudomonadota bacterium]
MPSEPRIPTNLRTLRILEILGESDHAMSATEINSHLRLPKQTVHRLCTTLEREGFLARQPNSKKFFPARRLRGLGLGLLHNSRSHIERHQILREVSREVRETVNFVVPTDAGMSYLDRVETDWAFRIQLPIGSHVPFHCTASGKCFMASLAPKARARFVAALPLEAMTGATHRAPEPLLEELAVIAKQGYSIDNEEFVEGMVAIAVPIRDAKNRFVAALAFHGPTQRVSVEGAIEKLGCLEDAAARLSTAIMGETEDALVGA